MHGDGGDKEFPAGRSGAVTGGGGSHKEEDAGAYVEWEGEGELCQKLRDVGGCAFA